jgi:hypothetical protein
LWRFAPIEHAVVAHHTNATEPRAILQRDFTLEGFSGGMVTPGHEQDDLTGHQNRVKNIPGDKT